MHAKFALGMGFVIADGIAKRFRVLGILTLPMMLLLFPFLFLVLPRRKQGLVERDVFGFTLRLDPTEFVDYILLRFPQFFDPRDIAHLQANLGEGDVFVDLGANIGFYSLLASRAVGRTGRVLAVEADPDTYARLQGHLEANGVANVRAVNLGVSDRRAILRLAVLEPPFRAASSFLPHPGARGIDVRCEPLLDVLQENDLDRVTGLKLDIEGLEFAVLSQYLADAPTTMLPDFVLVEYHRDIVRQAGGDVVELLKRHGYRVQERNLVNNIMVRDRGTRRPSSA